MPGTRRLQCTSEVPVPSLGFLRQPALQSRLAHQRGKRANELWQQQRLAKRRSVQASWHTNARHDGLEGDAALAVVTEFVAAIQP